MTFIEHATVVSVPLNIVYNQWTQFESYPYFMEGIKAVQPLSDIRLIWLGDIAGEVREWYTEISQQTPNQLIAWHSTSGPTQQVVIRFGFIDQDTTRITFQMVFDPLDFTPNPAAHTAMMNRRVSEDLRRFKTFIEDGGYQSGGWRGELKESLEALWNDLITHESAEIHR